MVVFPGFLNLEFFNTADSEQHGDHWGKGGSSSPICKAHALLVPPYAAMSRRTGTFIAR